MEVDEVASTGWELQPWPHNVLVTVNEHGRGALAKVYKKAVATAETGRRVVVVMQEAPREGEQKSRRAYHWTHRGGSGRGALLPGRDDRLWPRGGMDQRYGVGLREHPRLGRG